MNRKIITSTVIGLLISITFGACVLVDANFTNNYAGASKNSANNTNTGDNIDRWAVIIGVSNYYNYTPLPSPALDAKRLEAVLKLKSDKWNSNNIRLLIDSNAKRQNILDALDWLKNNADEGDTILFYFDGHGCSVNDTNGDEPDGWDEVICPYDYECDIVNGVIVNPINFITDDELSEKFDNISKKNVEGMFLIFSSCLSGGLVDWKDNKKFTSQEKDEVIKEIRDANKYGDELASDISSSNRVILTSTPPHCLGEYLNYFCFGKAVFKAVQRGKTTAEDIAHYARIWWLSKIRVWLLFAIGIIYIPLSISDALKMGYEPSIMFPFPMFKDGYPANDPSSAKLKIIG